MRVRPVKKCRLCFEEALLCDSHLIPRAMYRAYDTKINERGVYPSQNTVSYRPPAMERCPAADGPNRMSHFFPYSPAIAPALLRQRKTALLAERFESTSTTGRLRSERSG
jgi:hypothetical protein